MPPRLPEGSINAAINDHRIHVVIVASVAIAGTATYPIHDSMFWLTAVRRFGDRSLPAQSNLDLDVDAFIESESAIMAFDRILLTCYRLVRDNEIAAAHRPRARNPRRRLEF